MNSQKQGGAVTIHYQKPQTGERREAYLKTVTAGFDGLL